MDHRTVRQTGTGDIERPRLTQSVIGDHGRPSKAALADKKRKEEAKIDGAAEVAIGIKKDGDFPEWYKRVSRTARSVAAPKSPY